VDAISIPPVVSLFRGAAPRGERAPQTGYTSIVAQKMEKETILKIVSSFFAASGRAAKD
jgi:hypothetical protein